MKITFVSTSEKSGPTITMNNMVKSLRTTHDSNGYSICTNKNVKFLSFYQSEFIKYYVVSPSFVFVIPILHILLGLIYSIMSDVIVLNDLYLSGSIMSVMAKLFNKKVIIWHGGLYYRENTTISPTIRPPNVVNNIILNTMEKISFMFSDILISPDRRLTKYFQKMRSVHCKVVQNFDIYTLDTSIYSPNPSIRDQIRSKYKIPKNGIVMIFIGDLMPWHGADTIIDLFHELSQSEANLYLFLIGSGPLLNHLIQEQTECSNSHLIITGHISNSSIHKYIIASDFGLIAGIEPQCGIGNVPVEYMACGLPVIGFPAGELSEILLHDYTGLIVNNKQEMMTSIRHLLQSETKMEYLSTNSMSLAKKRFSFKSFAVFFETLLNMMDF
jgi:glycosyltransferase involved in cell wall biosynthesis